MRRAEQRPHVKAAPLWHFPEPAKLWLDNGLQVLVNHRLGQHVAAIALVLDAPLSEEATEIEGVATITQRCLDEGTRSHPGTGFAERLEDIGAVLGGSAGYSASELSCDVPVSQLPAALQLLAEAVREPELLPEDVHRHQTLRLAEIENTLANSAQRAQLAFRSACVPGRFRTARMAGGTATTVAEVSTNDVVDFHRRYYRPDGATLIISGNLTNAVFRDAEAAFGAWSVPAPDNIRHQAPVSRRQHCWLIDRPGAVQADIRLGTFGIDRGDPRWADVQVATYALGGAFLSRLNRELRERLGYTYGAHLVNSPMRDGGLISVQGSFRTEVVADAVSRARDLLDVANHPLTSTEVADAVAYANGVAPLRYSTAQGVTDRIATLVADGVNPEFVNTNALALTRVTPESATQAIAELLPPDRLSLVVVGDASALAEPLRAAGWAMTVHS
ncbi:MAG TPA: pitrilysin family protein [Propionicimonas sp.]|nr:pitrilysin family protein [Propionicimonas sp.]HRA04993.1 pitrilysin family protein [Propionicimonas sp.]